MNILLRSYFTFMLLFAVGFISAQGRRGREYSPNGSLLFPALFVLIVLIIVVISFFIKDESKKIEEGFKANKIDREDYKLGCLVYKFNNKLYENVFIKFVRRNSDYYGIEIFQSNDRYNELISVSVVIFNIDQVVENNSDYNYRKHGLLDSRDYTRFTIADNKGMNHELIFAVGKSKIHYHDLNSNKFLKLLKEISDE